MKYLYILLISTVFCGGVSAEMRVWQTEEGRSFKGEYLREQFGLFYFRGEDKQIQKVSVTNLIPSHVRYIHTMIPPKMMLSFRRNLSQEEGRYADPDVRLVDGIAEIKKISRKPFEGVLSGELYIVAKEVATDDYVMLVKKKVAVRFPVTKNPTVEIKFSARTRVYEEYNKIETRGRNYEGYLLVVTDPSGEILEMKTNLSWLDKEELSTFRRFNVFTFFNEECREQSVPRPKHYTGRGFI